MYKNALNPFEIAQRQVKNAWPDKLGAEPAVYEILKTPQRVLEVSFPVKMDDGSVKTINRLQISAQQHACGPYKGGIRFHPGVTLDQLRLFLHG